MNFINLTNGLLAIKEYHLEDYHFIRIQSTWCEQKRWEDILWGLSDDFLMCAALGFQCVIYDYGAKKPIPRAIWQGLEWIKYVLHKRWLGKTYLPIGRTRSSGPYFNEQYRLLSKRIKKRLDYFKKFVMIREELNIVAVTKATKMDGKVK